MSAPSAPLLSAQAIRIDVDGIPAIDGLSFETTAKRVLVLGASRALFEGAAGIRPISRGTLNIEGLAPHEALKKGALAGAPLDPPLPKEWTPRVAITWAAKMSGQAPRIASASADAAIGTLHLESIADLPLGSAMLAGRRAVMVAAALATGADALMIDSPLVDLDVESGGFLAGVIAKAIEAKKWVVFSGRLPLTCDLALAAEEAIVVFGSTVVFRGSPSEVAMFGGRTMLRVAGDAEALHRLLGERGASVETYSPELLTVHLPEGLTTLDLVRAAEDANVALLEMHPLSRTFS